MGDPGAAHSKPTLSPAEGASRDGGRVTATGRGAAAEPIIALAPDHGVRLREDADLAGASGGPIPLSAPSTGIPTHIYRAEGAPESIAQGRPEGAL